MHHELVSEWLVSAINTFKNIVGYRQLKLSTFSMQICSAGASKLCTYKYVSVCVCPYGNKVPAARTDLTTHDTSRPGGWWWIQEQAVRLHFLVPMWKDWFPPSPFFCLLFHIHSNSLGFPSKRLVHRSYSLVLRAPKTRWSILRVVYWVLRRTRC